MYAVARRNRFAGNLTNLTANYKEPDHAPVINLNKEEIMLEQIKKFHVGAVVRFCDRDFVIEARVIDNTVPGQVSVIDSQGFIHIGKIQKHKEYDVMAMTSSVQRYKAGYVPEKHGVLLQEK